MFCLPKTAWPPTFYIVGYVWVCQRLYMGSYLGLYIVGGKILYCGLRLKSLRRLDIALLDGW